MKVQTLAENTRISDQLTIEDSIGFEYREEVYAKRECFLVRLEEK